MSAIVTCRGCLAALLAAGWLFAAFPSTCHGQLIIDHDTTFDSIVDAQIRIVDGPNGPTTVEVVDGADIPAINAYGNSVLNVRGGRVQDDLAALNNARVNIFGGAVGASQEDVWAIDSSVINIYGGVFGDDIIAANAGTVHLYGGHVFGSLGVAQDGIINVYLQNFELLPYPPREPHECCNILIGTLADGSPIDVQLFVDTFNSRTAAISLHVVPEPASLTLTLIVALAACCWFRRKANVAWLIRYGRSVTNDSVVVATVRATQTPFHRTS